jgi:hypothetical protein
MTPVGWKHALATSGTPDDLVEELGRCATSFRHFLKYWRFTNQDTGEVQTLGEVLWPAQEEFVRVAESENWVFFLKARQLGETTIECAFDGWVTRFGPQNARVHLFHKRELEAIGLLERVKFGLENLPEFMRLPVQRETLTDYQIGNDEQDTRTVKAYPADNDTARGETCNHAHVDEWAFMSNPGRVWQSIEEACAGTVHFVTTEIGPATYTATFWRSCLAGDQIDRKGRPIYPCFIGALARPDRTPEWLAQKLAAAPDKAAVMRELPMRWEDAQVAGGSNVFTTAEIDEAAVDARGLMPPAEGRKYLKSVDVGRHKDAAVIIVLDVTDPVFDVVHYRRLREKTYPMLGREIEEVHGLYPGPTVIEDNAAGEAVREHLNIREREVHGFKTTAPSKARILQETKALLQAACLKWDPLACPQLDVEMRGYAIPDENVVQDSVMTLAIAVGCVGELAYKIGRVMAVHSA